MVIAVVKRVRYRDVEMEFLFGFIGCPYVGTCDASGYSASRRTRTGVVERELTIGMRRNDDVVRVTLCVTKPEKG